MTKNAFCAASKLSHTCPGDSGGSVVIDNKLAGVVSFATKISCDKNKGTGFTNLYNLKSWIIEVTELDL